LARYTETHAYPGRDITVFIAEGTAASVRQVHLFPVGSDNEINEISGHNRVLVVTRPINELLDHWDQAKVVRGAYLH
jgi:hypothetical protein